jgi:co-chaperonin GroES (HSP10)
MSNNTITRRGSHAFTWPGGNFTPLGARVLVRLDPRFTMSSGKHGAAIHIPDAFQRAPWWGEVVATGPANMDIELGDRVFFGAYNGVRLDPMLGINDGHEYWIMDQAKEGMARHHEDQGAHDMAAEIRQRPDIYAKEDRDA